MNTEVCDTHTISKSEFDQIVDLYFEKTGNPDEPEIREFVIKVINERLQMGFSFEVIRKHINLAQPREYIHDILSIERLSNNGNEYIQQVGDELKQQEWYQQMVKALTERYGKNSIRGDKNENLPMQSG